MIAYVTNNQDDTVSVVNLLRKAVTETIPVGNGPAGVAVTPCGRFVYVANSLDNTVSVIRTLTNSVVTTINLAGVGVTTPFAVRVSPDGQFVYVLGSGSNNVAVISTETNSVVVVFSVSGQPSGIGISPNGTHGYISLVEGKQPEPPKYDMNGYNGNEQDGNGHDGNDGNGQDYCGALSVVNLDVNLEVTTLNLPKESTPTGVAVAPQGSFALVADTGTDTLSIVDVMTNLVLPAAIAVGDGPAEIVFNRDGSRAYVTNQNDGTVSVVDTALHAQIFTISVDDTPIGIDITPGDQALVVARNTANSVAVIDTATNTVEAVIPVGAGPLFVAVRK